MRCQILFFGKIKKNISVCHLLKILPRMLNVNNDTTVDTLNIETIYTLLYLF